MGILERIRGAHKFCNFFLTSFDYTGIWTEDYTVLLAGIYAKCGPLDIFAVNSFWYSAESNVTTVITNDEQQIVYRVGRRRNANLMRPTNRQEYY